MSFSLKFLLLSAVSCLLVLFPFCQSYYLKGKVVDLKGVPLQGAIVTLKNGSAQSAANAEGTFTFTGLPYGVSFFACSFRGSAEKIFRIDIRSDSVLQHSWMLDINIRELEEVVVSSLHSGQKKFETLSTEIISGSFVKRNLGGSLMQSLEKLPGIKNISIGSSGSKPLIRGLGFNQVMVIENGIKHEGQQWGADHGLEIDQFNISRIEISKGPASFVYGSDALAGAIDIKPLPKPIENSTGGSVEIVGKSNNSLYGGSFNIFSGKSKWYFDARITYLDYADYKVPADTIYSYSYAVGLNKNFVRNTAGRELNTFFSAGYTGEKFRSVFYISNASAKSGFFANAHGLEPRNVNEKLQDASSRDLQLPYQQVSHTKIINRTTWKAGMHKIEANTGFQKNFRSEYSMYVNHGYMPPLYPSFLSYPPGLERQYDKDVWSLNIKDELNFKKHSIYFGVNSEIQKNDIGGWGFLIPAFNSRNAGGYAYDKYFLTDKLMLHGAFRYDYGRLQVKAYNDWFESDVLQNGETTKEKLERASAFTKNFSSLTWSAGLHYNPAKFTFTLNIGKGFRMPIAKELAANGVNYHYFRYEKGNAALQPEQSYQLDIGIDRKDEKKHFRITPFLNYFSNFIYLNPTAGYDMYYGAGNQVFNYAQARVLRAGAELQAGTQVMQHWHIEALAEYVYNRQLSGDKKGYSLPFTPPASALFTLSYEPKLFEKRLSETFFNIDWRLTAAQNNIVPPEKKTPGWTTLGFSMGSSIKAGATPVHITIRVQNLLNQRYLSHTSFYRLIELPEPGRNIVLSLKVPFKFFNNKKQS